jgi:hypothetical protein
MTRQPAGKEKQVEAAAWGPDPADRNTSSIASALTHRGGNPTLQSMLLKW